MQSLSVFSRGLEWEGFSTRLLAVQAIVHRSFFNRIAILCWLWLLTFPVLAENLPPFLEVLIEPSAVRLQLEMDYAGPQDQPALKKEAEVGGLFSVSVGDGPALSGQLKEVRVAPGTRRDEVSGESLAENRTRRCLLAVWEYPFSGHPEELVLRSKMPQPVVFVTHHRGVRLHDQTPLKAQQTLSLDWDDPWYSRYTQPELTRTPPESIACFLYLEPAQTRVELIARARDLQPFGQLDLGSEPELSAAKKEAVAKQVGEIFQSRLKAAVKDKPLELRLEKVAFVRRTPTASDAMKPEEPVAVELATLGAVFVGPALTDQGTLQLSCQLFSPRVQQIPVSVIQGEQVRKVELLPDAEGLITLDGQPEQKALSAVRAPQGISRGFFLLVAGIVLAVGALLMVRTEKDSAMFFIGALMWMVAGVGTLKWGWGPGQAVIDTRVQSLLTNVYQAFEAPTEEEVYDRLALSVSGELLSEVYLQTRKGLEAEKGVQVAVERVQVRSAEVTSADWWGDGMRVKVFWEVSGRVGHWGHEHERANLYKAEMKLKSVEGDWKLIELEVLDEIRM